MRHLMEDIARAKLVIGQRQDDVLGALYIIDKVVDGMAPTQTERDMIDECIGEILEACTSEGLYGRYVDWIEEQGVDLVSEMREEVDDDESDDGDPDWSDEPDEPRIYRDSGIYQLK